MDCIECDLRPHITPNHEIGFKYEYFDDKGKKHIGQTVYFSQSKRKKFGLLNNSIIQVTRDKNNTDIFGIIIN